MRRRRAPDPSGAVATDDEGRALAQPDLDVVLDAVALLEADERPDLGRVVGRVADLQRAVAAANSSTTCSCADRSTRIRLRAQQSWPALSKTE